MSPDTLVSQVRLNLIHYNLWTDVVSHEIIQDDQIPIKILSGIPPQKLDSLDPEKLREWVIPRLLSHPKLSAVTIRSWFAGIQEITEMPPKRVTAGILHDDGTVVYYFVHDGIVKPRQN